MVTPGAPHPLGGRRRSRAASTTYSPAAAARRSRRRSSASSTGRSPTSPSSPGLRTIARWCRASAPCRSTRRRSSPRRRASCGKARAYPCAPGTRSARAGRRSCVPRGGEPADALTRRARHAPRLAAHDPDARRSACRSRRTTMPILVGEDGSVLRRSAFTVAMPDARPEIEAVSAAARIGRADPRALARRTRRPARLDRRCTAPARPTFRSTSASPIPKRPFAGEASHRSRRDRRPDRAGRLRTPAAARRVRTSCSRESGVKLLP